MYRVYKVGDKFEIYWCPSAPVHYNDRIPYDGKLYSKKQAAYRRAKQLNEKLEATRTMTGEQEKREPAVA